jgi:HEAT repeat protein
MIMMDIADKLAARSSIERRHTRIELVKQGDAAVPALITALSDERLQVKQEAIKTLEAIGDETATNALVGALQNQDFGIRWMAAEALTNLGTVGLKAVLEALVKDDGLSWLRQGAHHVLHFYRGDLNEPLERLLDALDNNDTTTPMTWAAGVALQSLTAPSEHIADNPETSQ